MVPPTFESATLLSDGLTLQINVNIVNTPILPPTGTGSNFHVSVNRQPVSVINGVVSGGNEILLTLVSPVNSTSGLTVSYIGQNVTDNDGIAMLPFSNQVVTNSSIIPGPTTTTPYFVTSPVYTDSRHITPASVTSVFLEGATNIIGDFNASWTDLSSLVTSMQDSIEVLSSDENNFLVQMFGSKIRHLRQIAVDMIVDIQSINGTIAVVANQGAPPSSNTPTGEGNGWNN